MDSVEDRIARLEAINAPFDYDKARLYVSLFRAFLADAATYVETRGLEKIDPLFDVAQGLDGALPEPVAQRLQVFLGKRREYGVTTQKVCLWYLRESLLPERGNASHYEPLIQLLENGGDFYEHHGNICIRDAATMMITRTRHS
jgi:hypothetical protein